MTRIRLSLLCLAAAGLLAPARGRDNLPAVPQGVEVQARGPVHEAFASPTADPVETKAVPKKPPAPVNEMPPEQKPEGEVIWISGYWAWDDERSDFLWVSGTWRVPPPKKQWVSGYWREEGDKWQWVPGFWAAAKQEKAAVAAQEQEQEVTYLPSPPATPQTADPGQPPAADTFHVPGTWVWNGNAYAWRAGYWARVQPGYVWVADHYRWTPAGYVWVPGYWDLALKRRGILYAPVVISPRVVTVGFVYTPSYAVRDTVIIDSMFVRPAVCHYYFGDYYGPRYSTLGYESCVVYSRRRYDSIVVYERYYERRAEPAWFNLQINTYNDRYAGRAAVPPRTIVQNNTTIINNNITVAPVTQVAMTKNVTMVNVDNSTRVQAQAQAAAVQQVSAQRAKAEVKAPAGAPRQARVASLNVPRAQPVKPGMVAPKPSVKPVAPARVATATPTSNRPAQRPTASQPQTGTKPPAAGSPLSRPNQPKHMPLTRPGQQVPLPPRTGQPTTTQLARPAQPQRQAPPPTRRPPPRDEKKKDR